MCSVKGTSVAFVKEGGQGATRREGIGPGSYGLNSLSCKRSASTVVLNNRKALIKYEIGEYSEVQLDNPRARHDSQSQLLKPFCKSST
jgi:hypothetical protein